MINISNLTKYYDTNCAVDDISFKINKGEILGLLGPNGAGKTTTMRILTCFLKPTSGTIKVKDIDVLENPLDVKDLIGYLPENAPLYPDMITFDFLKYIASIRGIPNQNRVERIEKLVEICGLEGVMHQSIKELSRGYKQRVGIAHAMMSDPEILVLDEPTAGLDPNQIVQIRSIIKKMGKEKTVILSTHILSEAEATCDRIVIINKGKVVADGTPDTLGAVGLQAQVVRLTLDGAKDDEVRELLSGINGVQKVTSDQTNGASTYAVLCESDLRPAIYGELKSKDWTLLEFGMERQSLEETFRELTLTEESTEEPAEKPSVESEEV